MSSKLIFIGSSWQEETWKWAKIIFGRIGDFISFFDVRKLPKVLGTIYDGPLSWDVILNSLWFPIAIGTVVALLIHLNKRFLASLIFFLTCGLYIFEFLVPEISGSLTGTFIFTVTVVVTTAFAVYFLLIKD